ncbi:MAG: shikimate dehydrogenase [Anaerolineales bacterium]|nr:shikimate dehydrogenase [Anaerolineales bacterium]
MNQISGKTIVVGLMGWPVSHSKSPAMHNTAAFELGIDLVYVPLPVPPTHVPTAVAGLAALGLRGANVTVPHKQAVLPCLDEVDTAVEHIGAVNTIVVDPHTQRLRGYNTDWSGFLADLAAHHVAVAGRGCFVLGAGGSARAIAYALATAGGRVHILARRPAQAREIAHALGPHFPQEHLSYHDLRELPQLVPQWPAPLVINTTPLGMTPHTDTSVWPAEVLFPAQGVAYDLVYNPAETHFMRQAQAVGAQAINGLGMLLHQGAQAFALWTGQEPNTAVMRRALLQES